MELHPDLTDKTNHQDSPSNNTLQADSLEKMHEHFNVSVSLLSNLSHSPLLGLFQRYSGCRCIIDHYLLDAVIYAQDGISQDDGCDLQEI